MDLVKLGQRYFESSDSSIILYILLNRKRYLPILIVKYLFYILLTPFSLNLDDLCVFQEQQ